MEWSDDIIWVDNIEGSFILVLTSNILLVSATSFYSRSRTHCFFFLHPLRSTSLFLNFMLNYSPFAVSSSQFPISSSSHISLYLPFILAFHFCISRSNTKKAMLEEKKIEKSTLTLSSDPPRVSARPARTVAWRSYWRPRKLARRRP